ncbi:MAG: hypothetical protein KAQ92_02990, partial [Candidatus Aenigmarchaeota archaeon]|nr:hypothetical protein [Candidatus Aenigmarchaeota archaeon]
KEIKELQEEVEKRKRLHERHFNRYNKEIKKYADDDKQVEYSKNQAIREMNIVDELEIVLKIFKNRFGEGK